ncbi:MAG: J domain-containing protein [Planctomycetota bacterium]|jgi:curved DNA-binding protein CbpA
MSGASEPEFIDHYAVLAIEVEAAPEVVRAAFRRRLLEAHPDKSAEPTDGADLSRVMRAWEILGDPELRESYDRVWRLRQRGEWLDEESSIPHVTESDRPTNRARSVLFLLLEGRGPEALERLRAMGERAPQFLREHLEVDEFIDAAFLIAEHFEGRRSWFEALEWLDHLLRAEQGRRRHRPCFPEALERTRRILIRRTAGELEPRVTLEYLRRAEMLGLDRSQRVEVERRRCECYLEMGMRVVAARHLRNALELAPTGKGLARLMKDLSRELEGEIPGE